MTDNERVPIGEHVIIYRRGKRGIWTAEFRQDGKHCRQSLKTSNKKIATRRALVFENKLATGTYRSPAPATTISAAAQQYIEYLRAEGRAPKTIVRYRGELNVIEEFCRQRGIHRLTHVAPSIVDAYRAERFKTRHVKTVHHETMLMKQLMKWSESRHLIADNPLRHYRVSKPVRQPKPAPTLREVQQVLAKATGQRRLVFSVLAFTGVRVGELQHLRDKDVDLTNAWLHVVSRPGAETKTKLSRKIPIHPVLLNLLRGYKQPEGPLFFSAAPSLKHPQGGHCISANTLTRSSKG